MNFRFWRRRPATAPTWDEEGARAFAAALAERCAASLRETNAREPGLTQGQRYALAVMPLLGYTEDQFLRAGRGAAIACRDSGTDFNFQALVSMIVVTEYLKETGIPDQGLLPVATMTETVRAIIPAGL